MASKPTVAQVKGIEKLSGGQLLALNQAAQAIGIPVDWLATVISFETAGTFSPSIANRAGSGAVGLIQFMPSTAAGLLRVNDPQLASFMTKKMSFQEQLKRMVVPYFAGGTYKSLNDVYLKVFYPAAMNKAASFVVGAHPSAVYTQNAGFDRDNKGYVTREDITRTINGVWNAAQSLPRLTIPSGAWWQILLGVGLSAGMFYVWKGNKSPWHIF